MNWKFWKDDVENTVCGCDYHHFDEPMNDGMKRIDDSYLLHLDEDGNPDIYGGKRLFVYEVFTEYKYMCQHKGCMHTEKRKEREGYVLKEQLDELETYDNTDELIKKRIKKE